MQCAFVKILPTPCNCLSNVRRSKWNWCFSKCLLLHLSSIYVFLGYILSFTMLIKSHVHFTYKIKNFWLEFIHIKCAETLNPAYTLFFLEPLCFFSPNERVRAIQFLFTLPFSPSALFFRMGANQTYTRANRRIIVRCMCSRNKKN